MLSGLLHSDNLFVGPALFASAHVALLTLWTALLWLTSTLAQRWLWSLARRWRGQAIGERTTRAMTRAFQILALITTGVEMVLIAATIWLWLQTQTYIPINAYAPDSLYIAQGQRVDTVLLVFFVVMVTALITIIGGGIANSIVSLALARRRRP